MRKALILAGVVVVAIAISSVWLVLMQSPYGQNTSSFDFETGLGDWMIDAHVPEDPNRPGQSVAWKIELAINESLSGSRSVLFYIDGGQDDGTIWIKRKLSLHPNSLTPINASFHLWSGSESFNTLAAVVGYAGVKNPSAESDFQVIGVANEVAGWKVYNFSSEVQTDNKGEVYVALGVSVRWETEMSYFVDDVLLTLG